MGRRVAVLGGSVALALLAVGCGSGSPSAAPKSNSDVLQVIQAAASTTAKQKSMHVRGTMTMDLGAVSGTATGPLSADFDMVMQTKPLLGRMTMKGLSVAGHSAGTVQALITSDAFYMDMPMLTAQTGKPWAEIKFSDMKAQSGFDFSQVMSQAQQMNPSQYIAQLAASGDVHVVGSETVDGEQTTHYAGTVSMADALSHYSAAVQAQMKSALAKSGYTGALINVWLDSQGLVRRSVMSMQGGKGQFKMSMDVLDYGVPVNVTPPPPDQVFDLGRYASGLLTEAFRASLFDAEDRWFSLGSEGPTTCGRPAQVSGTYDVSHV